jgi:hypothetical protein
MHYFHTNTIIYIENIVSPYFIAWVMFYHNIWKRYETFFFLLTWFRLKTIYQGEHYNVYIHMGHYNVLSPTTIMQEKIKHENNCLVNQEIPLMVILLCLTHMYYNIQNSNTHPCNWICDPFHHNVFMFDFHY